MNNHVIEYKSFEQRSEQTIDVRRSNFFKMNPDNKVPFDILEAYYRTDGVISTLTSDATMRTKNFMKVSCNMCYVPCFIPHFLLLGCPYSVCVGVAQHREAAQAHKLVLRERTLLYEVETYTVANPIPVPICAAMCSKNVVNRHKVCLRLKDLKGIELIEAPARGQFPPPCTSPGTNIVTVTAGDGGAGLSVYGKQSFISLDAVQRDDFERFKTLVMAQKDKVMSGYVQDDAPEDITRAASSCASGGTLFGHMGAMLMQGMQNMQRMQGMQGNVGVQSSGGFGGQGGAFGQSAAFNNANIYTQQQYFSSQPPPPPSYGMSMDREIPVPVASVEAVPVMATPVSTTANDISSILSSIGCSKYSTAFEKQGVDRGLLLSLDESALVEIGVDSSLARKKILQYIQNNGGK